MNSKQCSVNQHAVPAAPYFFNDLRKQTRATMRIDTSNLRARIRSPVLCVTWAVGCAEGARSLRKPKKMKILADCQLIIAFCTKRD